MRRRRSTPYSSSEFYPGQMVFGPLGALDSAHWLHITKEMKAARKHKMQEHKVSVSRCRFFENIVNDSYIETAEITDTHEDTTLLKKC